MAGVDGLAAAFVSPPPAQRALLRWWWPGGAVDAQALCAQLRGFAAAGWGGVEIQPFRVGLPADVAGVHEVSTPRWWAAVATVMDEAERLGLTVDLTFGSCWPFGGGEAIPPELAVQELSLDWITVRGPARFEGRPRMPARPPRFGTRMEHEGTVDAAQALPEAWQVRIDELTQVVAVLALRGGPPSLGPDPAFVPLTLPDRWGRVLAPGWVQAAQTVDLTPALQPDGTLAWDVPAGDWQIVSVVRFVSDQRLTAAAGQGPQLVLDHLKREAFDAHAARVGDAAWPALARHAGRTWRAVFIDSLEIPVDLPWTDDFAEEFERRRGYALRPFLPLLLQPGWRNCFQARQGAPLFDDPEAGPRVRADYRRTVSELMIERLYAPFADWAARHGLQARTQAHGAPCDWLLAYGSAHIPETEDLAGGGAAHFVRVARSAAHLYGRPLVSAEAFCWLLEGLAVTPQQLRERADEFFVHGVQQLVGHGASAPVQGADPAALPWYPFAELEAGTPLDEANPLWPMLRPLADHIARCQAVLQRGHAVVPVAVLAPPELFAFQGAADALTPPAWHDAMLDAGFDWDWINADALLRGRIEAGAFVSPGGHVYRALLLPDSCAPGPELAGRLAACTQAGVRVLHIDAPSAIGQRLRAAGLAPLLDLPAGHGLQFNVRDDGAQRWLFLRNPGAEARRITLPVPAGQGLELWHTWTGRREGLAVAQGQATVALGARSARLLRLATMSDCASPMPPMAVQPARAVPLAGPWTVQGQGRGLGGRTIEFSATWPQLVDLSQQPAWADFAGQLVYRTVVTLTDDDLEAGPSWLDLGTVFDAARVQVNDAAPVTGCEPPFLFDLHRAWRPGPNRVTITVANRPENARRDPARPGGLPVPGRRLARLPTGLLGPVRCITAPAPATRWCLP